MSERDIFRPKMTEAQRRIVLRALRAYMIELIKEMNKAKPIGPDRRSKADYLESCYLIYLRFRDMKIGRPYPAWWRQDYASRMAEIYRALQDDGRAEETDKSSVPQVDRGG